MFKTLVCCHSELTLISKAQELKFFIIGFSLSNARFIDENYDEGPADDMNQKADGLCKDFFREFHGVMNSELVTNVEINNGHQGNVSLNLLYRLRGRPVIGRENLTDLAHPYLL